MELANVHDLEAELSRWFGHSGFRNGQRRIVETAVERTDLLALLPTSGGKSITYQLPAMLGDGITVVASPLVALIKDQFESLPASVRARSVRLDGEMDAVRCENVRRQLASGTVRLVYAAPERLATGVWAERLLDAGWNRLVVDEAHCIAEWGHDFRPDYRRLSRWLALRPGMHVMAVTATATHATRDEISAGLGRPLRLLETSVFRGNLGIEVVRCRSDEAKQHALLARCVSARTPGIVYVSSRMRAERLARLLRSAGCTALHYHAGMETSERNAVQESFRSGAVRWMVATVAFGMGVDQSDIRTVVHFEPARSLENHVQEIGRAGRDGKPARCVLFAAPSDLSGFHRRDRSNRIHFEEATTLHDALPDPRESMSRRLEIGDGISVMRRETILGLLEGAGLVAWRDGAWVRCNPEAGSSQWDRSERTRVLRSIRRRNQRMESRSRSMVDFIRSDQCRHARIVRYFGDVWNPRTCGNCDRCGLVRV